ncbi:MAG: MarR family transcriptional regulator [Hyphomicrobiaceae bacterium]|jgi:DNA-binding MarR family transcriptional regulator
MQDHSQRRLEQSVLHLLHRAGQVADELFAAEMAGSELTPRQYAVLTALARHEAASQTDIVKETGIDRSTLADIVKRLVQKGVLSRRRAKNDARAYSVRLTPVGSAILKEAEPVAQRVSERLLRFIAGTRRTDLVDSLASIVRAVDGKPVKEAPRLQARA